MNSKIEIEFGVNGYRQMLQTVRKDETPEQAVNRCSGYLLDKIQAEMKKRGYSSTQFYRAVFEDALDYETKFKVHGIVKFRRETKKVPKKLYFEVSVPRRE